VPKEAEGRNFEGQRTRTIPVGILMKDGMIFAIRDKSPGKYIQNPWRLLTGRQWLGEEKPADLINLAKECGFTILFKEEIGQVNNGIDYNTQTLDTMIFNLCVFEVVEGDFSPKIIYTQDEYSYYNQLVNCEGQWFSTEELKKQEPLHPLIEQALKILQKKNYDQNSD